MYQGSPQLHYINLISMVKYRTCSVSTFRDHDENTVDALILNQTISFTGHNIFFPLKANCYSHYWLDCYRLQQ